MRRFLNFYYLLAVCLLANGNVFAQQITKQADTAQSSTPSTSLEDDTLISAKEYLPLWEIGVAGFAISQQAYPGSDVNVNKGLALPYFLYRGESFRVDRDVTGYRAIKTPRFEFDVGFAGAFGSSSDKIKARQGMESLGTMIEFGPRLKWNIQDLGNKGKWRFELPLRGVFDASNGFKFKGMSLEPELSFERRAFAGWNYSTSFSTVWANQALSKTFYQVNSNEVTSNRGAYQAQSGLMLVRLTNTISHKLGKDWRVFGGVRIDSVNGAKNQDSPLVKKKTGASYFMGLNYTISRSSQAAIE